MPYIPFYKLCPEIAIAETRVITVLQDDKQFGLPKGDYAFVEMFCNECNCCRVFLQVHYENRVVATIAYGWKSTAFYKREFRVYDKVLLHYLQWPALDSLNIQSDLSEGILKMFKQCLFPNKEYIDRIKRHYAEFKKELKLRR